MFNRMKVDLSAIGMRQDLERKLSIDSFSSSE